LLTWNVRKGEVSILKGELLMFVAWWSGCVRTRQQRRMS
jgi:hypothetical protein